jgi:hypothetical protein
MRMLFAAMMVAAGIGFAGPIIAAPANGVVIGQAAKAASLIDQVRCRCVSRRWNGTCRARVCDKS